jgi:serine/threonine protein phosphatase PrpC
MYAVHQEQGLRDYMEDFVDVVIGIHANYDYYAVFDGHGGKDVAEYLKLNLGGFLKDNLASGMPPKAALESAYELAAGNIDAYSQGSTALVVLMSPFAIWIANTGDCRAVLNRFVNNRYVGEAATIDHKPNLPSEHKRITDVGGTVVRDIFGTWRVNGNLALSRSFGDHYLGPAITWKPDIYHLPRTDDMRALIFASDGLWDVMSNQDVVNVSNQVISGVMTFDRQRTLQLIAKRLVETAMDRGTTDNVSVVFIVTL